MTQTVTALLVRVRDGERGARDVLYAAIYDDLRRLARRQVARYHPDRTLNATALVHELFLKLDGQASLALADRNHLFAVAARAMRQIAVDYARGRRRVKRGGDQVAISLDEFDGRLAIDGEAADAVLAVDRALASLQSVDPRLARVVELRFFGGLSVVETAQALAVSAPTIKRDTRVARAFLQRALGTAEDPASA